MTVPLPGVKGRARNKKNTFVLKSKSGNLVIMQRKGKKKLKPLYVLKEKVKIPPFKWLEQSIDMKRPLLARMMSADELLKAGEKLGGVF